MTRRPKTKRPARGASRAAKRSKPAKKAKLQAHPLDPFIAAGAHALQLKISQAWLPTVRSHLKATLRHGALVAGFPLPDETDPAPVFEA